MTQPASVPEHPRPLLSLLIALVLGLAAGAFAFLESPTTFASTGIIHVRPVISSVLFDKTGPMPMYESFVLTQIGYIKSERCIDIALLSPQWLIAADSSRRNISGTQFAKHLEVVRDGEFLHVTYSDPDPKRAVDAVAAVINAYQQLIVDLDPDNAARRQQQLEQLKEEYETKLQDAKKRIADAASPYTPDSLIARYTYKNMESNQAEIAYKTAKAALEDWLDSHPQFTNGAVTQTAATTTPASQPGAVELAAALVVPEGVMLTDQEALERARQIAKFDAAIRELLKARDISQAQFDEVLKHTGPSNPLALQQGNALAVVDKAIKQEVMNWKPTTIVTDNGVDGAEPPAQAFQRLTAKTMRNNERWQSVKKEVDDLETKVKAINQIDADTQLTRNWLEQTKQKREEARVEAGASGRILILSTGDTPVENDSALARAIPVAISSGLLTFLVCLCVFKKRAPENPQQPASDGSSPASQV